MSTCRPSQAASTASKNSDNTGAVYPPDTDGDVGPNHYVQMVNLVVPDLQQGGHFAARSVEQQRALGRVRRRLPDTELRRPDRAVRPVRRSMVDVAVRRQRQLVPRVCGHLPDTGPHRGVAPIRLRVRPTPRLSEVRGLARRLLRDVQHVPGSLAQQLQLHRAPRSARSTGRPCWREARPHSSASIGRTEWSLLPSDADGTTPPPAGSPNYMLGEHWSDQTKLTMYKFARRLGHPRQHRTSSDRSHLNVNAFVWACLNTNFAAMRSPAEFDRSETGLVGRRI